MFSSSKSVRGRRSIRPGGFRRGGWGGGGWGGGGTEGVVESGLDVQEIQLPTVLAPVNHPG